MSQIRYYIFVFLALITLTNYAQNNSALDKDALELTLKGHIKQAELESDRGDYYKAKDNLEKARGIAIKISDKKSEGIIHTKIAKLQFLVDEPQKAILSLQRATEIQREIEDYPNLALTYNIRGYVHSSLNEYQTALDYFNSANTKFEEENLEHYISEVALNEAKVYIKLKNYNIAKDKLEKTIILAKKFEQQRILSSALILSGKVSYALGNNGLALTQTLEGLDIAKSNSIVENINDAYLSLSDIHQKDENYRDSNSFLRKHLNLSDSLFNIQRENISSEKSLLNINKYRSAENQELKDLIDEANDESNLARITTILSISLITILSLLTLSLYKNNNIRLRTNNMLHKKNDELIVAKEKAEFASKTKANFLSTVTHELRTPLYAVTGLTNMLLDEDPKDNQIPHLKSLKFSGDYLLTFINDILQINKIEANKVELDPEQFNLNKKIQNVISALNNSALDNNTKIHFQYDKVLPDTFVGDQLKISQILINLLGNAIKFTKDGEIWVNAHP